MSRPVLHHALHRVLPIVLAAAAWLIGLSAAPALAEPGTTPGFGTGASATGYAGLAFDQCTAPPVSAIQAWNASPYRAVGVYIGGVNRSCTQPQLTASWVTSVANLRWAMMPIYVGRQPTCGTRTGVQEISSAAAKTQAGSTVDHGGLSVP